MPDFNRDNFRLACILQQALVRLQTKEVAISIPRWEWQRCQELARRLEKARSRKFLSAAATLASDLESALFRLREQLNIPLAAQREYSIGPRIPALTSLYGEVRGLFEEFDNVDYDLKKRLIVVTTEPIELEEVYLGEFEIRLDLSDLGRSHPYTVIAKDPNRAAGDDSITHPHVKENHLCEGDGAIPIQRALATGRLADFFQIVNQILHTYNSGSAYAQLDEWSGDQCADCGGIVPANEIRCCDRCDSSVCDGCRSSCEGCNSSICSSCRDRCAHCYRGFCNECIDSCEDCDKSFCHSCLSNGKCKTCHDCDKTKTESGTGTNLAVAADAIATSETDVALQSAGVGETPVPA